MNCNVKLLCLDVDGTLVDDTKNLPLKNLEAIRWAHFEKGVHIAIISGRNEPSVRNFMDMFGIQEAVPSLNGCLVRDYDGTMIQEHLIDCETALGIHEIAKELGCTYFYYHHNDWCVNFGQEKWWQQEQEASGSKGFVTDLDAKIRQQEPNKILGVNEDPQLTCRLKASIEKRYADEVDCFLSTPQFLEILPKGVSKATAVDALCVHYGIGRENVMAIGDFYNDVDMLKAAKIAVAMANAPKDIQAMATYTTKADNSHCGVAEAIARFIM